MKTIQVEEVKITFSQDNDCMDSSDLGQSIEVSAEDGGGGKFLVIKTERWAIDSIQELAAMLQKVMDIANQTNT